MKTSKVELLNYIRNMNKKMFPVSFTDESVIKKCVELEASGDLIFANDNGLQVKRYSKDVNIFSATQ